MQGFTLLNLRITWFFCCLVFTRIVRCFIISILPQQVIFGTVSQVNLKQKHWNFKRVFFIIRKQLLQSFITEKIINFELFYWMLKTISEPIRTNQLEQLSLPYPHFLCHGWLVEKTKHKKLNQSVLLFRFLLTSSRIYSVTISLFVQ